MPAHHCWAVSLLLRLLELVRGSKEAGEHRLKIICQHVDVWQLIFGSSYLAAQCAPFGMKSCPVDARRVPCVSWRLLLDCNGIHSSGTCFRPLVSWQSSCSVETHSKSLWQLRFTRLGAQNSHIVSLKPRCVENCQAPQICVFVWHVGELDLPVGTD